MHYLKKYKKIGEIFIKKKEADGWLYMKYSNKY